MPTTDVTILDYVEGHSVPGNPLEQPSNEFWALRCLRDGLEILYQQAANFDKTARERINPNGDMKVCIMGSLPEMRGMPQTLLACYFQWYAVSACQYVWTVAAILRKNDEDFPLPREYGERVIPEVQAYRDKVAAHYAWATRNKRDNDAERLASILPPLAFQDDSFYVGSMTVSMRRGERVSNSSVIQPWSLCKIHEAMRKRFWPDSTVDPA